MTTHSDCPTSFEQDLERQARHFAAQSGNGETEAPRSFLVADLEFRYERDLHAAYATSEGADSASIRWPFDRIAAVCWTTLRFVSGQAAPEIDGPHVLTAENNDEPAMVAALFDALHADPDALLVMWGSENRDLPVLRRAALQHDLLLPLQLRNSSPQARERIDLCRAITGLGEKIHLQELAAALSIPAKPTPAKQVGYLAEQGHWTPVEEQCLADVITTALLATRHLAALGLIEGESAATDLALIEAAAKAKPNSAFVIRTLKAWARARDARSRLRGTVYRTAA